MRVFKFIQPFPLDDLSRFDPAMFGTLRYLPEKKTGEFLERESGVAGNVATNKPQHWACDNCRVKKVCDLKSWKASFSLCVHSPCSKRLTEAIETCQIDPLQRPKSGMFTVQDPFSPLQLYPRPHAERQEEASAQLF